MLDQLFVALEIFEDGLWVYLGFPIIILLGIYLTVKSNFIQIHKFPHVIKIFIKCFNAPKNNATGIHPLRAFFACVGGCIGIGNVVAVCTAIQIGGPGALFWLWVTALMGMIIKYAEVYLGMRYREPNGKGGYNGGPMYFLKKAFKSTWIPTLVCLCLCIYGVEVLQFNIVINSVSTNLLMNKYVVTALLLMLVILGGSGGVQRVGTVCSAVIPFFVIVYLGMGCWVLWQNLSAIPEVIQTVFTSAFTGHAAIGGFAGSGVWLMISQGIRRACYSGDIGVGYASMMHSESSTQKPEKQASLVIFDIFLDTVICTMSVLLVLISGIWKESVDPFMLVQNVLGQYFPYMSLFMAFFLFLLGYSTIIAYFCVGLKCAQYLSPLRGKMLYYTYAIVSLLLFSFIDAKQAMTLMSITQAILILINLSGMYRLRKEVSFDFISSKEESNDTESAGNLAIASAVSVDSASLKAATQ